MFITPLLEGEPRVTYTSGAIKTVQHPHLIPLHSLSPSVFDRKLVKIISLHLKVKTKCLQTQNF